LREASQPHTEEEVEEEEEEEEGEEEEEEEEEEGLFKDDTVRKRKELFKANAVNEEDCERDLRGKKEENTHTVHIHNPR